ncbi:Lactose transport system permease protein LacF [Anaerolineae bacterium]|nr:Lactose transport system permease protein LacF [Anaerolineae bacterium]
MEQTTAYSATSSGGGEFDRRRFMLAVAGLVAAFIGLYGGFVFLRDSEAPKIITAIFAIIWGVAGIGALFFVANYAVESLPPKWTTRIQPYIFVGPAVVLLAWYLAGPTLRTFVLSLYNETGTMFVGLDNYRDVFTQRIMIEAWSNNIYWLVLGTTTTVGLGLLIAILADRSNFERVAKSFIFLPMAISMVGAGVIWKFVFDINPNIGVVNAVVASSGNPPQDWLRLVQPANNIFLIMVMVWMQTGFAMVLISAAIKGIPEDLLEAARVDGATEFGVFVNIIIPGIAPTLLTVTTTVIIFTLKVFDIVMVMTGGQFGTEVIGVRFYRELFTTGNQGVGSAIAIILLLAVSPVMIYNLWQFSKRQTF